MAEPSRLSRGIRATIVVIVVSTVLAAVKISSGWIGNSYALIADGIESLLDIVASLVVMTGLRIAARPPDRDHPYGHGKAESLAAMVVAVALLSAGVAVAIQSVREILVPHHAPAPFTLVVLVVVVLVKEVIFRRLTAIGQELSSTSLSSDAWHHRSDALTSLAAFVGISVALIGGPGYESADDWAALAACAIILFNGQRLLRVSLAEVMDAAPPDELERSIRTTARAVSGVVDVEKCLARKSGPGWLIDIHIEVDGALSVAQGHEIAHRVKDALIGSSIDVLDVLVHVEPAPGAPGARDAPADRSTESPRSDAAESASPAGAPHRVPGRRPRS